MKKWLLVGLVGLAVVVLAAVGLKVKQPKFGAANVSIDSTFNSTTIAQFYNGTQDVVGTHKDSTTTVGASFLTADATSTYISKVSGASKAVYQIFITSVTSALNHADFTVQGSNDQLCDTQATSVSSTTNVVKGNINWYDAMTFLTNRVHPTTFGVNSTSAVYNLSNAIAGTSEVLSFNNLNFACLKLSVSASSSLIYVGLNTAR